MTNVKGHISVTTVEDGVDAITVEITNQNLIVESDGNAFQAYTYIKVLRGNTYLTPGTDFTISITPEGLTVDATDDIPNKRHVLSIEAFTGDTVTVGTILATITIGDVAVQRVITVARNNKFIVYPRGNYSPTAQYVGNAFRREVVKYNGFHYITKITAGSIAIGTLPTVTSKWEAASDVEFIATGLLFAENGFISIQSSNEIVILNSTGTIVGGFSGKGAGADAWRLWLGGVTAATSAFKVHDDGTLYATGAVIEGEIRATSGHFGLLDIIGSTIESKYLKISDDPIPLKSVATAQQSVVVPAFHPIDYISELNYTTPSLTYESEVVTIDGDTTIPLVNWRKSYWAYTFYTWTTCTLRMTLEVWNNGVLSSTAYYDKSIYNGCTMTDGEGVGITNAAVERGTVQFKMKLELLYFGESSVVQFSPILSAANTGAFVDITISYWVRRTALGSDGLFMFANQNRYMYFRGAGDADDEFEVNIGGKKIGYKDSTGWNLPGGCGGGSRLSGGGHANIWGLAFTSERTNSATTTIHHSVTDTKFTVNITPKGSLFNWYLSSITAASSPTANDGHIVIVCSIDLAVFDFVIVRTPY